MPARPGAGRPLGSMSRLAKDAREKAQATGALPHEILLEMARGRVDHLVPVLGAGGQQVRDPEGFLLWRSESVVLDVDQRRDAAKAAAPYFAPKIGVVEMVGNMADADLDEIIRQAAGEAGLDIGALLGELGARSDPDGDDPDGEQEGAAEAPRQRRRALPRP